MNQKFTHMILHVLQIELGLHLIFLPQRIFVAAKLYLWTKDSALDLHASTPCSFGRVSLTSKSLFFPIDLHLPITGQLYGHTEMSYNKKEIRGLLNWELGIMGDQEVDFVTSASNRVLLGWLERLHHTYLASYSYMWATRAYLLHLLRNTIFSNKSSMHVHISYL